MATEINPFQSHSQGPKKRVLFIITQSEFGGAQQFLYTLISRMDRSRFDIMVATGSTGDGVFTSAVRALEIKTSLIAALKRHISPITDLHAILQTRKLIKEFGPDTLFLNSSKAGFIGSIAARLCMRSPRVVYRIGGWSFNDPGPKWKRALWIMLEKLSAGWKDVIIVNNKHDFEQAKRLKIKPRDNLVLIHNGIDPYKLELLPRDQARLKLFELMSHTWGKVFQVRNIVGAIANFYPTKGLEYLIEAARDIDDPHTIVCVIGDGSERPKLEQLIKERGLEKKVFLVGRLEHAAQYLSAFDIFVLPSVKEGFPWSVLEAMSAKIPVVATAVGAVPEIIETGVSGFIVKSRDPDQLSEAVNHILGNELRAREVGIRAHQRVLLSFTLEKMVGQIVEILQ